MSEQEKLFYRKELASKLITTMNKVLDFREKEMVKLRFGLNDGAARTLEEISFIFKVTRERSRQIISKAIRKIQHYGCRSDKNAK